MPPAPAIARNRAVGPRRQSSALNPKADQLQHAVELIHRVCRMAGSAALLDDIRTESSLRAAIRNHDTAVIFNWLTSVLSYQGISDRVARGYMARHGQATWGGIERGMATRPPCPKLRSYWQFQGCRYDKGSRTCAEPDHLVECPLPKHDLRNGRLNQTAFSLFLFIRDIAGGDLVSWLDSQLTAADRPDGPDRLGRMRQAVVGPLRHVYGVSDKTLAMALSDLLLNAPSRWRPWREVGAGMIAIDTLVCNFLHRTGILGRAHAQHHYGRACYQPGGCAAILEAVATAIDARQFNPAFPERFPRFVQHAIWRYCAQEGLAVCNGNRVDDRKSCQNKYCRLFSICDRIRLNTKSILQ